ncbi:MAG: PAC2 family protein, partial [Acidimicrobiales bacterium]
MSGEHVTWEHRPTLDKPVLVAAFDGWNDAGDAATWAVRHLDQRCDATTFAEIDPEEFYDFSEVRPIGELVGDTRQLHWPANTFSATTEPRPLILLQGIEPQLRWRGFTEQVLAVASQCGASMIVTLGALLADVPHSRPVTVYCG